LKCREEEMRVLIDVCGFEFIEMFEGIFMSFDVGFKGVFEGSNMSGFKVVERINEVNLYGRVSRENSFINFGSIINNTIIKKIFIIPLNKSKRLIMFDR
jgi:hypothetical protein